jgi:uncharacterized protein YndB with AHSA1/START domain
MDRKNTRQPWNAVANATRRRLIELLRDGPRTTGDLCRAFPTTRFAVMKHLAVLERAGLLTVRRQGRERWNALNPQPLSELAGHWPTLAGPVAAPSVPDPAGASAPTLSAFRIDKEVYFDASPGRVFDALTFNVSAWWGSPYLLSPDSTGLVVEPQLGGRFYEEWGHRQGIIRGIVTAIRQDERLEVTGTIAGPGPLPGTLRLVLERREGGTLLRLEHAGLTDTAGEVAVFRAMWDDLVRVRLKAFVER